MLRNIVSEFMKNYPDEFKPFMDTEEGEIITEGFFFYFFFSKIIILEKYQKYCDDIIKTNTWGGQLELKAISHSLQQYIIVYTGI